jgi:hypothetical protein
MVRIRRASIGVAQAPYGFVDTGRATASRSRA